MSQTKPTTPIKDMQSKPTPAASSSVEHKQDDTANLPFKSVDNGLKTYYQRYSSHRVSNFHNRNEYGPFLRYIIEEELNDSELPISTESELYNVDYDCDPNDCAYVDKHAIRTMKLPFPDWAVIPESTKEEFAFYIFQYCHKYNKCPSSNYIKRTILPKIEGSVKRILSSDATMQKHSWDAVYCMLRRNDIDKKLSILLVTYCKGNEWYLYDCDYNGIRDIIKAHASIAQDQDKIFEIFGECIYSMMQNIRVNEISIDAPHCDQYEEIKRMEAIKKDDDDTQDDKRMQTLRDFIVSYGWEGILLCYDLQFRIQCEGINRAMYDIMNVDVRTAFNNFVRCNIHHCIWDGMALLPITDYIQIFRKRFVSEKYFVAVMKSIDIRIPHDVEDVIEGECDANDDEKEQHNDSILHCNVRDVQHCIYSALLSFVENISKTDVVTYCSDVYDIAALFKSNGNTVDVVHIENGSKNPFVHMLEAQKALESGYGFSIHKFGDTIKIYWHFGESIMYLRMKDVQYCSKWWRMQFKDQQKRLDVSKWQNIRRILANSKLTIDSKLLELRFIEFIERMHMLNGNDIFTGIWNSIDEERKEILPIYKHNHRQTAVSFQSKYGTEIPLNLTNIEIIRHLMIHSKEEYNEGEFHARMYSIIRKQMEDTEVKLYNDKVIFPLGMTHTDNNDEFYGVLALKDDEWHFDEYYTEKGIHMYMDNVDELPTLNEEIKNNDIALGNEHISEFNNIKFIFN